MTQNNEILSTGILLWRLSLLAVLTMGVSVLLTRLCIKFLPKFGFIDRATHGRKIHEHDTPRGGGIAVVAACMAGIGILFAGIRCWNMFPIHYFYFRNFAYICIPLCILVPLGMIDDRCVLKSLFKLLGQIATAAIAWWVGLRLETLAGFQLPEWGSFLVTLVWFIAFINAYNLIDGMDGLASGLAIISAACMAFVSFREQVYYGFVFAVLLGSACMGFLVYNFPPAKIFLGDTGSMTIGYLLGAFGIILGQKITIASAVVVPLLACGVPILDVIFAVWRRVTRKLLNPRDSTIGIMTADRLHIHHRILNHYGSNQFKAVMRLYLLALILAAVAIFCLLIPCKQGYLGFFIFLATFSTVAFRFASIEIWNSSRLIFDNWAVRRPSSIAFILQPVYDVTILFAAAWLTKDNDHFSLGNIIQVITPVFIVLLCSRNYHVLWKFPSAEEYFRFLFVLAGGVLLSWLYSLASRFCVVSAHQLGDFFAYTAVGCLAQRFFLHYLRMRLVKTLNNSKYLNQTIHRTMLYGLGDNARTYVNHSLIHFSDAASDKILGYIAADPVYRNTYCYNLPVFGHLLEIDDIFSRHPFSKIVICHHAISPNEYLFLEKFCVEHNIVLTRFCSREQKLIPRKRIQGSDNNCMTHE